MLLHFIFSAPEPKAQVHYCDHALSVRPSSVVVNFSHFRLLLWNRWTEFNETLQEAKSQRPLPSLCFSGRPEKQDGCPCLRLHLAETFSISPLKPVNGSQRNLTGSKISTSSTKFVFSGRSENKMAALASDWRRHFLLLLWNRWTEFNETWQEARSQRLLPSLCFSGRSVNSNVRLGRFLKNVHIVLRCTICGPFGLLLKWYIHNCFHIFQRIALNWIHVHGWIKKFWNYSHISLNIRRNYIKLI